MRQNTKASADARKGFDHAVQILSSQFIRDALSDMRQGGQSDSAKDFEVFQEGGPSRIQFTGGSTGAPKGAARIPCSGSRRDPRYLRDHRA